MWIDLCALDRVRNIIKRNVDKGLLPNFDYGLIDFEHLYNTIGSNNSIEPNTTFPAYAGVTGVANGETLLGNAKGNPVGKAVL